MAYEIAKFFLTNETVFEASSAISVNKSLAYQLANFLIAHNWVVKLCSNGVTVGSTYTWTATNLLGGGTGAAHSWLVLESPEGFVKGLDGTGLGTQSKIYFLIDIATSSTLSFIFDRIPYAGGTVTQRPAGSANERVALSASNTVYSAAGSMFNLVCAVDGSFTVRVSVTGGVCFVLSCDALVDYPVLASSGLPFPFAVNIRCSGYVPPGTCESLGYFLPSTYSFGWGFDGAPTKNILGCLQFGNELEYPPRPIGLNQTNGGNAFNLVNECGHVFVSTATAGKRGVIGRYRDLKITGADLGKSTVNPGSTIEFCVVGNLWVAADKPIMF